MNSMVILSVFILFSISHLLGEALHNLKTRYRTKPFLLPTLGLYYYSSAAHPSMILICAIAGGWLGDMFLMLPDPDNKKKYLLPGIAAFILGHLFYIGFFFTRIESFSSFPDYGYVVMGLFILSGIGAWLMIRPHAGNMTKAVTAYVIIIVLMGVSAASTLGQESMAGAVMAVIGAFIFVISDTINGYNRFAKPVPHERIYTMTTYLLGQFLIVQGVLMF